MNIFQTLTEKSWLVVDRASMEHADADSVARSAAPTGLHLYFAVATVLFAVVTAMYLMRMGIGHIGFGLDWRPTPKPLLLWVNTFLLILSSLVFQQASAAARLEQADRVVMFLLIAGLLAFVFLIGQLIVWQQLARGGYYLASNPANSFFYLITTLHGLHLVGGLFAWTRTTARAWNGTEIAKVRLSVDLCAKYWHFLLIVWLAFFCLLLAT
ncbi:MAG TPA: cytochrome c oxidase subunit 3 [Rhizomicrobium sp.]